MVLPKFHPDQGSAAFVQRAWTISGAPSPSPASRYLENTEGRPIATLGQPEQASAFFNQSLLENPTTPAAPATPASPAAPKP